MASEPTILKETRMRRETSSQHMRLRRSLAATSDLDERDPSLINLPLPLPSIPVLTPLLEPLVGGSNEGSSSSAATPTDSPPASTPTSGGGGGSTGGGNGGGSGSTGGGSGSGSSGSGSSGGGGGNSGGGGGNSGGGGGNSGGGGGSSGGGSSGSGGTGSGGTGSGGTGSGSTPTGSGGNGSGGATTGSGSSGGGDAGGSSTASGSTSNGGTSGATTATGSDITPSGSAATPSGTAPNGNGNLAYLGNGSTTSSLNVNDGSGAATALSALSAPASSNAGTNPTSTMIIAMSSAGATGTALTLSGTAHATGTGAVNTGTSEAATKHGLSGGATAGIIVVVLLVLAGLVVVVLRRRSIAKREERQAQFFGSGAGVSKSSIDTNSTSRRTGDGTVGTGNRSARSSFATTFDQGQLFRATSPAFTSEFNIQDMSTPANANGPEFPPMAETRNGPLINTARFSTSSSNSGNSRHSQFLDVPNMPVPPEAASSMSVRPFSPSDIYSFPQPPSTANNSIDWLNRSHPNSPIAESMRTITPLKVPANDAPMSNPFSDPVAETSPFTDAAAPSATSDVNDAPIEVIRRPFAPTLEDETVGIPGDRVRVVRVFDDGWAFIENVATLSRGLIPIDCLREAGEELPAFLTSKRISSMSSESAVYLGNVM